MTRKFCLTTYLLAVLLFVLYSVPTLAATPDEDIRPIQTGVTVTGIVEDDYNDGLLLTTAEGTSYLILTPDAITLEQEEAFHKRFKGHQVTLTGNLYREEDGSLSLYVASLPTQP